MSPESNDRITRCYALLDSLKKNLPDNYEVEDKWVNQYNDLVIQIEQTTGIKLEEFKVPQSEIVKTIASSNMMTGEVSYAKGLWCERSILTQKLDALLTYFSLSTGTPSEEKRKVGFSSPLD